MGEDRQSPPHGNQPGSCLRVELTVENNYCPWIGFIQQGGKFPGNVVGGKNVMPVKITGGLIIRQGVSPQHPPQGGKDKTAQRQAIMLKLHQLRQLHWLEDFGKLGIIDKGEFPPVCVGIGGAGLQDAPPAGWFCKGIIAIGAEHTPGHAIFTDKMHHRHTRQLDRPA